MQTVTINCKLYSTLYDEGIARAINADTLISVYCLIKFAKGGEDRIRPIQTKNGRIIKNYRLLHKVTKISEQTLKKYVPILQEIGVFNFSKDGSCYLKGNDKTNKEFGTTKIIRLEVKEKISEMNLNVLFVRVKTKEKRIKAAIERTNTKIKIIGRLESKKFIPKKDLKKALKWKKEGVTLESLKSHHNKVVLSNQGFYLLKKEVADKKTAGAYWKKKLKSAGKIKTKRNSKLIQKCSLADFLVYKKFSEVSNRLSYWKGCVWEETVSEFTTEVKVAPTQTPIKKLSVPKDYLGFDMIAFWENQ